MAAMGAMRVATAAPVRSPTAAASRPERARMTRRPSVLPAPRRIFDDQRLGRRPVDNYRLQVVVGTPAPMNEGKSDNFKLRIGARLQ